jgi:hypothetical protein
VPIVVGRAVEGAGVGVGLLELGHVPRLLLHSRVSLLASRVEAQGIVVLAIHRV